MKEIWVLYIQNNKRKFDQSEIDETNNCTYEEAKVNIYNEIYEGVVSMRQEQKERDSVETDWIERSRCAAREVNNGSSAWE